jgi:hypothetical protein
MYKFKPNIIQDVDRVSIKRSVHYDIEDQVEEFLPFYINYSNSVSNLKSLQGLNSFVVLNKIYDNSVLHNFFNSENKGVLRVSNKDSLEYSTINMLTQTLPLGKFRNIEINVPNPYTKKSLSFLEELTDSFPYHNFILSNNYSPEMIRYILSNFRVKFIKVGFDSSHLDLEESVKLECLDSIKSYKSYSIIKDSLDNPEQAIEKLLTGWDFYEIDSICNYTELFPGKTKIKSGNKVQIDEEGNEYPLRYKIKDLLSIIETDLKQIMRTLCISSLDEIHKIKRI